MSATPEAAERIKAKFREWDLDNNGVINREELGRVLGALGLHDAEIDQLFRVADKNASGAIEYAEFVEWICKPGATPDILNLGAADLSRVNLTGGAAVSGADIDNLALQVFNAGGTGRIRFKDDQPALGSSYTICGWVRRMERRGPVDDVDSVLLGNDNAHWLMINHEGRLGVCDKEQSMDMSEDPVIADGEWVFFAVQGSPASGLRLSVATATRPELRQVVSAALSLSGSGLRTIGWAKSALQVSLICVHNKAMSALEVHAVYERSAAAHKVEARMPAPAPAEEPEEPPPRIVTGRATRGGQGVEGVTVDADGAAFTVATDRLGRFEFELEVEAEAAGRISLRKAGLAPCAVNLGFGVLEAGEVQMQPVAVEAQVSAVAGGVVADPASGSTVTIQPNSLCYPDGRPFDGEASVRVSVIDATDPEALKAMPGDFSATSKSGASVQLQSFGAMFVGLEDTDGEELACKSGMGMDLDLHSAPLDFSFGQSQKLPSVFAFNETTGKWEEVDAQLALDGQSMPSPDARAQLEETGSWSEPTLTVGDGRVRNRPKKMKKGGNFASKFEGKVWTKDAFAEFFAKNKPSRVSMKGIERSGWWNCDSPYVAALLCGYISPVELGAGAVVYSVGEDYHGRSNTVADEDGMFSVMAQCNSKVKFEVTPKPPPGALAALKDSKTSDDEAAALEKRFLKSSTFAGPYSTAAPGSTSEVGEMRFGM